MTRIIVVQLPNNQWTWRRDTDLANMMNGRFKRRKDAIKMARLFLNDRIEVVGHDVLGFAGEQR